MNEVPVWHCDLKPLVGDLTQLTVGTQFQMNCAVDIPVKWNGNPKIQLAEKTAPYSLVIVRSPKLDANSGEFIVTSYRTGEMKPEYIRVLTGESGFEASGLEWKIQSVLKQDQPPQPYPPFGPFLLPLPSWVWVVVALVLASMVLSAWVWFRKIQNRRRLRDDLKNFGTVAGTRKTLLNLWSGLRL